MDMIESVAKKRRRRSTWITSSKSACVENRVFRHCERSEAIQNIDYHWIASGYRPRNDGLRAKTQSEAKERRRRSTWITSSKRSAARGAMVPLSSPNSVGVQHIDNETIEILRSSERLVIHPYPVLRLRLARGYPCLLPTEAKNVK